MAVRTVLISSVVGLGLGVGAVGLGAWAESSRAAPDHLTSATIHACAADRGGALRVASHCARREHPLSWSRAPAPVGPRGYQDALPGITDLTTTALSVASVRVPAGHYLVTYRFDFGNDHDDGGATCNLRVNGVVAPDARSLTYVVPGDQKPVVGSEMIAIAGARTLDVVCSDDGSGSYLHNGTLDAVQLGVVTGAWTEPQPSRG